MSTAVRRQLPARRPNETRDLEIAGQPFTVTTGFDPDTGRPAEVFLDGPKVGTDMAAILDDTSVVISVALQCGVLPGALAKSVARVPAAPLTPSDLAVPTGPARTSMCSVGLPYA